MRSKIDRTGEKGYNNFESEMIIIRYKNRTNIDVYFPEYNWTFKNADYGNFKKGTIKCPYERRIYGAGYIGEGKYEVSKNCKATRVYSTWHSMLERCYSEKLHEKESTYIECKASEEFLNFQNFGHWDEENYYKIGEEIMCLDKDILIKGNKIYSSDTCIYVPQTINMLFTKSNKTRGNSVIGTHHDKNGRYQANCHMVNPETGKSKNKYLGIYDTEVEAFKVYKYHKERNIKEVADYYLGEIPEILYDALYNYEVEITD